MADIYTDEKDERTIRQIIEYGFNSKTEKLPKYTVLRIALAKSLKMDSHPDVALDTIDHKGSEYHLREVTGHGRSYDEPGYQNYDGVIKALLSVYHSIDLFKDSKQYKKLLQRHIRRGLRELRTGWSTSHDIAAYLQEDLLSGVGIDTTATADHSINDDLLLSALSEIGVHAEIHRRTIGPRIDHFFLFIAEIEHFELLKRGIEKLAFMLGLGDEGVFLHPTEEPKIAALDIPRRKTSWQKISGSLLMKWVEKSQKDKHQLPIWLGLDATGQDFSFDLAQSPHLLIAGTTGSGKSVTLHTLILSLLRTVSSDHLQLALIDPKYVELSRYGKIPHLFGEHVANSIPDTSDLLGTIIDEMEGRNRLLESVGARNLEDANQSDSGQFPRIVVIVEEIADLLSQSRELEDSLVRLAQKGRSAGIHLVLTTQRPDAATFAGLLRSNIPGRIALRVQKGTESRIILDETGAEKLLGEGDMLVKVNSVESVRVHGAYTTEDDINNCLRNLE